LRGEDLEGEVLVFLVCDKAFWIEALRPGFYWGFYRLGVGFREEWDSRIGNGSGKGGGGRID
jgi:hypothetical protein